MAYSKLKIINAAAAIIGSAKITQDDIDNSTNKLVRLADELYEMAYSEMFGLPYDWKFATTRASLNQLWKLTIDSAPTPAAWTAGATLTGATSGTTCTVVSKVSDLIYVVTEPSDDFTLGEVISDGTNSRDCAATYPVVAEYVPESGYDHQYQLPSDLARIIAFVDESGDDVKYPYRRELLVDAAGNEIPVLLTDEDSVFIKYIRIISTVTIWPHWFAKLVYLNLALLLCEPMKQKVQKNNQIAMWFDAALFRAVESNGLEDADVGDSGTDVDEGNNDVVNAASDEDVPENRIVRAD